MFKRILVALNGSDSDQVVETLHQVQLQPEAEIVMAHVVVMLGADPDIAVDRPQADVETLSQPYLEQLQVYQAKLPCKSKIELVTGDPAEEIVRLANIHQADLIVMGSRGLTGMDRILQGSVSSEVVQLAPCSVLVVRLK